MEFTLVNQMVVVICWSVSKSLGCMLFVYSDDVPLGSDLGPFVALRNLVIGSR